MNHTMHGQPNGPIYAPFVMEAAVDKLHKVWLLNLNVLLLLRRYGDELMLSYKSTHMIFYSMHTFQSYDGSVRRPMASSVSDSSRASGVRPTMIARQRYRVIQPGLFICHFVKCNE